MGTLRFGLALAASLLVGAPAFAQAPVAVQPEPIQPATQLQQQQPPTLPATVDVDTNTAGLGAPLPTTPVTPAPNVTTNKPAKAKAAAPALPTSRGTISAVDNVAMTVTVDVKGKDEVFKVTSKTRIFNETKPGLFADAKAGEKAVIEYRNGKDKSKEALTLRLTGAGGAPTAVVHKDSGTPEKKAPTKAKKASIKKKKAPAKKGVTPTVTPGPDAPVNPAPEATAVPTPTPTPATGGGAPTPNP